MYLLSKNAADADFLPFGKSGNVLLNRPHWLETVETVPTVLNPNGPSISPPIITATSTADFKSHYNIEYSNTKISINHNMYLWILIIPAFERAIKAKKENR